MSAMHRGAVAVVDTRGLAGSRIKYLQAAEMRRGRSKRATEVAAVQHRGSWIMSSSQYSKNLQPAGDVVIAYIYIHTLCIVYAYNNV